MKGRHCFGVVASLLYASVLCSQPSDSLRHCTLMAFGDINLGRSVGQWLLNGELEYPFGKMGPLLRSADIVFANLESPLSDQRGETESPSSNVVFCGPPVAASVLHKGGVSVVSTANNHAFDYGLKGLNETIRFLRNEQIAFAGTSEEKTDSMFAPAIVERNGIRVGFLGYTQLVNIQGEWAGHISLYDGERAEREVRSLKEKADFVVASFHGGTEYADSPDEQSVLQMRALVDAGADVVLGHHPHVPQGIELYKDKLIVHSLGNFVFYQPQFSWTGKSYGLELFLKKDGSGTTISSMRLIPFRPSLQPSQNLGERERTDLLVRVKKLSSGSIQFHGVSIEVQHPPRMTRE
ncbi:MAG: CapA family protein [Bacteroidota bacterium]